MLTKTPFVLTLGLFSKTSCNFPDPPPPLPLSMSLKSKNWDMTSFVNFKLNFEQILSLHNFFLQSNIHSTHSRFKLPTAHVFPSKTSQTASKAQRNFQFRKIWVEISPPLFRLHKFTRHSFTASCLLPYQASPLSSFINNRHECMEIRFIKEEDDNNWRFIPSTSSKSSSFVT